MIDFLSEKAEVHDLTELQCTLNTRWNAQHLHEQCAEHDNQMGIKNQLSETQKMTLEQ